MNTQNKQQKHLPRPLTPLQAVVESAVIGKADGSVVTALSALSRQQDEIDLVLARGESIRCPVTGILLHPQQHDAHVRARETIMRIRARKASMKQAR